MIEAKPAEYGGHQMRSVLETQWARTLDALDIAWEYEPQAITLPSGATYLPDFWLPELGIWLEAKGTGVPRVEKAVELARTRTCRCVDGCSCRWPGGELVLIGHPARECTDRTHRAFHREGHPDWSSAHGQPAWLFRCTSCRRIGWAARTVPLMCRACRELPVGGHVYGPGDADLRFASPDCMPPYPQVWTALHIEERR